MQGLWRGVRETNGNEETTVEYIDRPPALPVDGMVGQTLGSADPALLLMFEGISWVDILKIGLPPGGLHGYIKRIPSS